MTLYMKMMALNWGAYYQDKVLCKRTCLEGISLSSRVKQSDVLHDMVRFYWKYRKFGHPRQYPKFLRDCLAFMYHELRES